MVRPRLNPSLPVLAPQHVLPAFELEAQMAFEDLYVFLLVGVEMQRGFVGGEGEEVRVLELEDHFVGEGAVRVGN